MIATILALLQAPATPEAGLLYYGPLGILAAIGWGAAVMTYRDGRAEREKDGAKIDALFKDFAAALSNVTAGMREVNTTTAAANVATCAALQKLAEQLELAKRLEALERRGARSNET